jgi:hypothetical protein
MELTDAHGNAPGKVWFTLKIFTADLVEKDNVLVAQNMTTNGGMCVRAGGVALTGVGLAAVAVIFCLPPFGTLAVGTTVGVVATTGALGAGGAGTAMLASAKTTGAKAAIDFSSAVPHLGAAGKAGSTNRPAHHTVVTKDPFVWSNLYVRGQRMEVEIKLLDGAESASFSARQVRTGDEESRSLVGRKSRTE